MTNRIESMLGPDQEPVADDRGRRHGEVVQGIDAHESVLVGHLDDERVALFAHHEDVTAISPRRGRER